MRKNYLGKLDNLKIKYKKDPKKFIVLLSSILFVLALTIGSSYAYLTYIGKTGNTTTISAGTLALNLRNEANTINLDKILPQEDKEAIESNTAYTFTVKNTGTIGENYTVKLNNNCVVGKSYTINGTNETVSMCIPNTYIRAAIKEGQGVYKTIKPNQDNELVLETGKLGADEEKNYSLKIWLSWDTPNTYNNVNDLGIVYTGKLSIDYEQSPEDISTSDYVVVYNANGGTGTMANQGFNNGESKALTTNTFTRSNYSFLGWSTKINGTTVEYTNGQTVTNLSETDNDKVNLYAVWSPNKFTVNVTIVNGVIKGVPTKEVEYNTFTTFGIIPSLGTTTATVSCTNGQTATISGENLATGNITNDTTCTVIYELMHYNIVYDANTPAETSTSNLPEDQIKTYGTTLTLSSTVPENTKYAFLGWSITPNAELGDKWYDPSGYYTVNNHVTLYAQWYDVDTLEKNITGSVHSGDFTLKTAETVHSASIATWNTAGSTTSIAPSSGYNQVSNGTPFWYTGSSWVTAYSSRNGSHYYRNANSSSAQTGTRTASILQVRQRTGTASTGTMSERITGMQNEIQGCLSYLAADADLMVKNTSQSVSMASGGTKNCSIAADAGYTANAIAGYDMDGSGIANQHYYAIYTTSVYIHNLAQTAYTYTLRLWLLQTRNKTVGTATEPIYGSYPTNGQKYLDALDALYETESTKLFKYTECGNATTKIGPKTTSSSTASYIEYPSFSGHDRVVATTGFQFYNDTGGSGVSYSDLLALHMNDSTSALIQVGSIYRRSNTTRYYFTKVSCNVTVFVIDRAERAPLRPA